MKAKALQISNSNNIQGNSIRVFLNFIINFEFKKEYEEYQREPMSPKETLGEIRRSLRNLNFVLENIEFYHEKSQNLIKFLRTLYKHSDTLQSLRSKPEYRKY